MSDSLKSIYEKERSTEDSREGASRATSPSLEVITVYRTGYSDGYTHTHGGALYRTFAEASACGRQEHGAYAVEPRAYQAIDCGDGTAYIIESGPIRFVEAVKAAEARRLEILSRLTPEEQRILGVKP